MTTHTTFKNLKTLIIKAHSTSLQYFWRNLLSLQADASKHGLGICLLKNGQPIASKSLIDAETKGTNKERNLLYVVHTYKYFHVYLMCAST